MPRKRAAYYAQECNLTAIFGKLLQGNKQTIPLHFEIKLQTMNPYTSTGANNLVEYALELSQENQRIDDDLFPHNILPVCMKLLFVRDRETSSGAEERSKESCGFPTKCQQGKYMMYYFRKFRYLSTSSGPKNSWRTCCFYCIC